MHNLVIPCMLSSFIHSTTIADFLWCRTFPVVCVALIAKRGPKRRTKNGRPHSIALMGGKQKNARVWAPYDCIQTIEKKKQSKGQTLPLKPGPSQWGVEECPFQLPKHFLGHLEEVTRRKCTDMQGQYMNKKWSNVPLFALPKYC
jgi:hypothetical protein